MHKIECFNLASDFIKLRNSAAYQQMRVEINRRDNPLSGGTDWEKIHQLAEQISLGLGADLLTSAYFVTAASKTRGVRGLASGLELMLSVISYSAELTQIPNEKIADIINWAVTKMTPEIKKMTVTSNNVRDWYRCEYSCQKLFELITQKQPQQVPNLDVLGYLIFEKIDRFETNKVTVPHLPASHQDHPRVKAKRLPILVICSLISVGCIVSSYLTMIYHKQVIDALPSWVYQPQNVERSIAQRIDDVFSLSQQATSVSIYPEQVNLLVELDNNYQRFANVRTILANLSLLAMDLPSSRAKVQQASLVLAQYASSLSPILGRTYYIDDLLKAKEYARADIELSQLNNHLKALLIKRTLLTQQLNNHTLTEFDTIPAKLSSDQTTNAVEQEVKGRVN